MTAKVQGAVDPRIPAPSLRLEYAILCWAVSRMKARPENDRAATSPSQSAVSCQWKLVLQRGL